MMQKPFYQLLFCILLLWNCQSGQEKKTSGHEADSMETIQTNQDEKPVKESVSIGSEAERATQIPNRFNQFIDTLPEWMADSIGPGDIFYSDEDTEQAYAEIFDMRNELEEKESISISSRYLYKVTLDNCYVIFVEKQVFGSSTTDGFYAGRWTHSIMTCTKDGRMIDKADLGSNYMRNTGSCRVKGTRSPLCLEVEQEYYLVGSGERGRAPQPSRLGRITYHVNLHDGCISHDTLAVYDYDRYIGDHGQNIQKNLKERVGKSRRKDNTADNRFPQAVKEWIANFPEWTSDSISEHIFDAYGLVPEETIFPKEFQPVEEQDSARQQMIEMHYGHRITTDSLYILFARKVCNRRNPSDRLVPESFFTQTVMVYSHEGRLKGWYDLTRNIPSKNRTCVSGYRNPLRLYVKEATIQNHDYEHTHYIPVILKEIEWRVTQGGTFTTETILDERCKWYPYKHPGVCEPWYKQLSPF